MEKNNSNNIIELRNISRAAGLRKAGMGQLLLCPVVTIRIVALYLMGCCCSTDEKAFFKFLHDGSPFLRVAC